MRSIVIVDPISTGYNFVEDAVKRGYRPVALTSRTQKEGTMKELIREGVIDEEAVPDITQILYRDFQHQPLFLEEKETYEETLRMVRELEPAVVVAGADTGVILSTRLSADLGLPGNLVEELDAMTRKDAMQEALQRAGLRYILGKKVTSPEEALAFCRENALDCAVVKPLQSAGSQGLFLCDSLDEVRAATETLLSMNDIYGRPNRVVLVQERIRGEEYIVNTVSSGGKHRLNTFLRYRKEQTPEGGNIYDYIEFVDCLEAGTEELLHYAMKVADALHYRYGMIHGEYMVDEKGPVLIEVNCRPMGCSMPADFLDRITGQHETDTVLNALLEPEHFIRDIHKPFRVYRKAYIKLIMVPEEMETQDHPIWEVARQLKSTYKIAAGKSEETIHYAKTRDLESNGGMIYLVHEDGGVVENDLRILRLLERNYFQLLLNDGMSKRWFPYKDELQTDPELLIKNCGAHGAVLVAADSHMEIEGAQCITPGTISDAGKGFDYVIICYEKTLVERSESDCVRLLFDTMELVREGGKVIIPASTYRYLSYNRKGTEELMLIKGLKLECSFSFYMDAVTGVRQEL